MKYKFIPDNDSNLIVSPICHDIIGDVDIDNLDLLKMVTEGPKGSITFKADTKEEQEKLNAFMKKFIKDNTNISSNDDDQH